MIIYRNLQLKCFKRRNVVLSCCLKPIASMGAGSKCGLVWRDPPLPPSLPSPPPSLSSPPFPLEVGPYPPLSLPLPFPALLFPPPVRSLPLPLEVGPLKSS